MTTPQTNPTNVALLTSDGLEAVWMDTCPGCRATVSALKHDFSLCSQLQNALYRIRQLGAMQTELEIRVEIAEKKLEAAK